MQHGGRRLGVALLGGVYRGLQLSHLHSNTDAAHLAADQQQLVSEAFASTAKAEQIYKTLAPDVQQKVHDAVQAALSHGIGGSLKFAAIFAVAAFIAVLCLVPKGILHADRMQPAGAEPGPADRQRADRGRGNRYPLPAPCRILCSALREHAARHHGEVSELA